jgi:hypothetical protein
MERFIDYYKIGHTNVQVQTLDDCRYDISYFDNFAERFARMNRTQYCTNIKWVTREEAAKQYGVSVSEVQAWLDEYACNNNPEHPPETGYNADFIADAKKSYDKKHTIVLDSGAVATVDELAHLYHKPHMIIGNMLALFKQESIGKKFCVLPLYNKEEFRLNCWAIGIEPVE